MDDIWLGYDPESADSILEYAGRLEGKTLREATDLGEIADPHNRRGAFGNALEEYYFHIEPNSCPTADFDGAGAQVDPAQEEQERRTLRKGAPRHLADQLHDCG